jgi:uncharacterized protein (TIGR02271 family)
MFSEYGGEELEEETIMPLVKLKDFYPDSDSIESDSRNDIKNFEVCTQGDEKVGSVDSILVDDREGRIRYLVVDTGFWIFGKKVLLPIGLANVNYTEQRVYVDGLSKDQVEDLPNLDDLERVDRDYEEQVRGVYRPIVANRGTVPTNEVYDRENYSYDQEPQLYGMNAQNHRELKLYEERLIADKQRRKTGEVRVGKHVETETARVSVPVEQERVVIERNRPTGRTQIDPDKADFGDQEVTRMEVYEETPDIHKEAFVREQVQVRKTIDHDVADAQEEVRREELDIDTQGRPVVDKKSKPV